MPDCSSEKVGEVQMGQAGWSGHSIYRNGAMHGAFERYIMLKAKNIALKYMSNKGRRAVVPGPNFEVHYAAVLLSRLYPLVALQT